MKLMRLAFYKFDDSPFKQHFALLTDDEGNSYRTNGSWIPPANVWDQGARVYDQQEEFSLTFDVIKETVWKNKPITEIEITG